jgi:hypothetical protein
VRFARGDSTLAGRSLLARRVIGMAGGGIGHDVTVPKAFGWPTCFMFKLGNRATAILSVLLDVYRFFRFHCSDNGNSPPATIAGESQHATTHSDVLRTTDLLLSPSRPSSFPATAIQSEFEL